MGIPLGVGQLIEKEVIAAIIYIHLYCYSIW